MVSFYLSITLCNQYNLQQNNYLLQYNHHTYVYNNTVAFLI